MSPSSSSSSTPAGTEGPGHELGVPGLTEWPGTSAHEVVREYVHRAAYHQGNVAYHYDMSYPHV